MRTSARTNFHFAHFIVKLNFFYASVYDMYRTKKRVDGSTSPSATVKILGSFSRNILKTPKNKH